MKDKELLILWTKDDTNENIDFKESFPEMIKKQYYSRLGRAGRGRLWVPPEIDLNEIDWIDNELTIELGKHYGGIVFYADDLNDVISTNFDKDSIITDLKLNNLFSEKELF